MVERRVRAPVTTETEMRIDAEVANLNSAHSYRGYYSDLAFEQGEGTRPAADLLAECKAAKRPS